MEEKKPAKKKRTKKQPTEKPVWNDQQLAQLGEIFGADFADFYKSRYDENGNVKPADQRPAIPGLRPPPQEGQQEDEEQS